MEQLRKIDLTRIEKEKNMARWYTLWVASLQLIKKTHNVASCKFIFAWELASLICPVLD